MKIVIIGRIIFPLLSPRAFRATELANEFARLGHDVTLYAVLGKYDYTSFMEDTGVKVKNINMLLATSDSDDHVRYNLFDKIAYHAFGKILEYPDIEFCWKVPLILKKEKNIDLLITIAYPHPIHWGAAIAKKLFRTNFPKFWISDCGDPYMGNQVERKPLKYFKYVENFWGKMTDIVSIPVEGARSGYLANIQDKIRVIPQGFNLEGIKLAKYTKNEIPHFAYAGSIYIGQRDPSTFLKYLSCVNCDFVFTVFTNNHSYYSPFKELLGDKLNIRGYIPRDELIHELSKQDFLINLINPNTIQSPSKLIDYYLSARPILDVSTPFEEIGTFNAFMGCDYMEQHKKTDIYRYDIKNVVQQFIETMNIK